MIRRPLSFVLTLLLVLTVIFAVGCEMEWVRQIAFENLGSFVVDVVQTGVNETLSN
jgi:hypothetical protein